jgi:hypothetical protein
MSPEVTNIGCFKNWLNKLHTLPLSKTNKTKKLHTIFTMAENNGYKKNTNDCFIQSNMNSKKYEVIIHGYLKKTGYGYMFPYLIIKLFKNTKIKTAFKTIDTLGNIKTPITNEYKHTFIYRLICLDYKKSYIGRAGLSLCIRYTAHVRVIHHIKRTFSEVSYLTITYHKKCRHILRIFFFLCCGWFPHRYISTFPWIAYYRAPRCISI